MLHHTKGEELKLHIPTANELHSSSLFSEKRDFVSSLQLISLRGSSYAQAVGKELIIMAKVLNQIKQYQALYACNRIIH